MGRMKQFGKYILWIALFWIFSDILIYVGLNTTYKDMTRIGNIPNGVSVVQIQSTKVNGRIKININNPELSGKYLKIDLYSGLDNLLGTQYIEIGEVNEKYPKTIEKYFKIADVKKYEITIVDEPGESTDGFMDTAMSTITVILFVIKVLIL